MLSNIPNAMQKMARSVVINHPQALEGNFYRKIYNRSAPKGSENLPTIGGLGLLHGMDEVDFSLECLGAAAICPVDVFTPSGITHNLDFAVTENAELRFLIEPLTLNAFNPLENDIFLIEFNNGQTEFSFCYEILSLETVVNIPPYAVRYVCNRAPHFDFEQSL